MEKNILFTDRFKTLIPLIKILHEIEDRVEKIPLAEKETFYIQNNLFRFNFQNLTPVEIFERFVYSVSTDTRLYLGLEDWIRLLVSELRRAENILGPNISDLHKEFINICIALCLFYLQDYSEIPPYLDFDCKNDKIKDHLNLLKHFVQLDFNGANITEKPKVLIIVSIANEGKSLIHKTDIEVNKHILNIQNYDYRRIDVDVVKSYTFEDLDKMVEVVKKYEVVFFIGHGNDGKNTITIPTKNCVNSINIEIFKELFIKTKKKFNLLAFLNCSHSSFKSLSAFSKYALFPTVSKVALSESILKTFLQYYDRYYDLKSAIYYSQYSTIFKFDESLTFNVETNP